MGGSDDPSNLVDLTIEEHAEAHRVLWQKHGLTEDYIAWKALLGQIDGTEARLEACRSPKSRAKMSVKVRAAYETTDLREQRRTTALARYKDLNEKIKTSNDTKKIRSTNESRNKTSLRSLEMWSQPGFREKMYESRIGPKPIVECPYCGKTGGSNVMKRWHFDNCKKRNV